jgi:hypothetical protein
LDKDRNACHLCVLETDAPAARPEPTGAGDEVSLGYWSHRRGWEGAHDMGRGVKTRHKAPAFAASTDLVQIRT